jgi:hypothetical protein
MARYVAIERARLEHDDKDAMLAWLSRLDPEIPVALEATFGWPWVADLPEEPGMRRRPLGFTAVGPQVDT